MHRRLTLTHERSYREKMAWGPQPETLKDFALLADCGVGFQQVVKVKNNYQRRREFAVNLRGVRRLRLEALATNGLNHARVFEIRCEKKELHS